MALGEGDIARFFSRVAAWPEPGELGLINCHYFFPKKPGDKQRGVGGRPFAQLKGFLDFVEWAKKHPEIAEEIYFCTSTQARPGPPSKSGQLTAWRKKENTLYQKSLFLDLDIKAPPKGYANVQEAIEHLNAFIAKHGLPPFSALVHSGSGFHVYWISDRRLTIDAWQPFADGLDFIAGDFGLRRDVGVTIDPVRILRVPGTVNRKRSPQPVKLLFLAEHDIDFDAAFGHIKRSTQVSTKPVQKTEPASLVLFDAGPAPFSFGEDLTSNAYRAKFGHGSTQSTDLDFTRLFTEGGCPMFRNALETGGAGCSQGLWMLQGLASTFLHGGRKVFHSISKGYNGYNPDDTDAMFDRKEAERDRDDLGPPTCLSLQRYGSKQCATCPHLTQLRSPLNLLSPWVDPKAPPPVTPAPAPIDDSLQLPRKLDCGRDYRTDDDGHIIEVIEKHNKKGEAYYVPQRLFGGKISQPWIEYGNNGLHLTVINGNEPPRGVFIPHADLGSTSALEKVLFGQMCPTYGTATGEQVRVFMKFWIQGIKQRQKVIDIVPYGWAKGEKGFAYGGKVYMADGAKLEAGTGDHETRENYTVEGSEEPWHIALKLLTSQRRPGLDVLVATAFASPLAKLTGVGGCTLSALGPGGANKSSALQVGLAVWGGPLKTRKTPSSSRNSILGTAGEIQNLPLFWDDVRTQKQLTMVRETISEVTEKAEGSKMKSDRSQQKVRTWLLHLIVATNMNLQDDVLQNCSTDSAPAMRLFQIEIPKAEVASAGQVNDWDASPAFAALDENFGHIGAKYAAYLGRNVEALRSRVLTMRAKFSEKTEKMLQPERFWNALCATILVGAECANELFDANLDIPAMEEYLVKAYLKSRTKIAGEMLEGGTQENTATFLMAYLKETGDHTIRTQNVPGQGRAGADSKWIGFVAGPARKDTPIHVQWALQPKLLRISREHFRGFLMERGANVSAVIDGLTEHFGMKESRRVSLAKGCPIGNTGEETVYVIPYTGRDELIDIAEAYTPSPVAGIS